MKARQLGPGAAIGADSARRILSPSRWPLTLFDDARATAIVTTKQEAPELLDELGRLRKLSFAGRAPGGAASFGLDEYDEYYKHLVVFDKSNGAVVAGTRLGLGDEIVDSPGWEALYTARYWEYREGMKEVARRGVEAGRTWVSPLYQKRLWGLALLWKALALLLDRRGAAFLFGVVSLTGYPPESESLVMNYLWRYHRTAAELVGARSPVSLRGYERYAAEHEGVPQDRALRELTSKLNKISLEHPVPVLLRHYVRFGAELGGGFAAEPLEDGAGLRGDKVAALLLTPAGHLRASIERFKSL